MGERVFQTGMRSGGFELRFWNPAVSEPREPFGGCGLGSFRWMGSEVLGAKVVYAQALLHPLSAWSAYERWSLIFHFKVEPAANNENQKTTGSASSYRWGDGGRVGK